jgi:hypothetical protein
LEGKSEWALRAGRRQKLTLLLLPTPIRHCCVHSNGQDFDSFHDIGNGTQIGGVTRASSSSKAFASKTFQAFHLYTEEDADESRKTNRTDWRERCDERTQAKMIIY